MRKQETHSGIAPIVWLIETTGAYLFPILDWIAGSAAQGHDEDSTRRCRLLVASTLVIFLFARFFLYKVHAFEGFMSPTTWVFVSGSRLMLVNLLLLRWTRSSLLPSKLLLVEFGVSFGLMAYYNGGYDAASLIWNLTIPLLAVVLVGPRFGLCCAGLIDGTRSKHTRTWGEQVHSQDGQQGMSLLNRVLDGPRPPSGT